MSGKRICDWSQCMRVADTEVRVDIPKPPPYVFTTLMWWRCGDHTPPLRPGTKLTCLVTGDVSSLPMPAGSLS